MRIISGTHKGRTITPPRNLRARPTTDFAKENLFNVLAGFGFDYEECDVLDLFAGTGSVSYEFASRGARSVTAVEINAVHHNFIRAVAKDFGFANLFAVKANVFNYLNACTRQFHIIFSDAPYDLSGSEKVISMVFERGLLHGAGSPSRGTGGVSAVVGGLIATDGAVSEAGGENSKEAEEVSATENADFEGDSAAGFEGGSAAAADADSESDEFENEDGLLIFEHSKDQNFESHPNFVQTRNYGSVQFSFFRA
jgi:16S rRNA (guanine(966)-N(2))-methyltransferase RsmD